MIQAAIDAGDAVRGSTSPNPPVGCAIYSSTGTLVATGATAPAGGPHAERQALQVAGAAAKGSTVVVTLEPCNHTGKTGPCSQALVDAGVAKVVYLTKDPNPVASGGAEYLQSHDVAVEFLPTFVAALQPWLVSVVEQRVSVTAKYASTLDGFSAALDRSSKWITGSVARDRVHADRARRDAIIIGTGTAIADNPSLSARFSDGSLRPQQPRRVVVGTREVPAGNLTRLGFLQYATLEDALKNLWDLGCRDVLIEGGATLLGAAFSADLVDRVQAYIAPKVLGRGLGVIDAQLASTMSEAKEFRLTHIEQLGTDVLLEMEKLSVYGSH